VCLVRLHGVHGRLQGSHRDLVLPTSPVTHHAWDRNIARLPVGNVVGLVGDDRGLGGGDVFLIHQSIIIPLDAQMVLGLFLLKERK